MRLGNAKTSAGFSLLKRVLGNAEHVNGLSPSRSAHQLSQYEPRIAMPQSSKHIAMHKDGLSPAYTPSRGLDRVGPASAYVGKGAKGPRVNAMPQRAATKNFFGSEGGASSAAGAAAGAAGGGFVGALGLSAMGAGLGAGGAWMTGGDMRQGAFAGAMTGSAAAFAAPATMKFAAKKLGQDGVGGYATKMSSFMNGHHNTNYRRASMASGAMLGGMMFGGNKSHRRGFNGSRGNAIGR